MLQCVAVCRSVSQCVAVCCSVLQCVVDCVAVCCSLLQFVADCIAVRCRLCRSVLQIVLQCVTVCGSVLQFVTDCVAVCHVLQCVAHIHTHTCVHPHMYTHYRYGKKQDKDADTEPYCVRGDLYHRVTQCVTHPSVPLPRLCARANTQLYACTQKYNRFFVRAYSCVFVCTCVFVWLRDDICKHYHGRGMHAYACVLNCYSLCRF